MALKTFKPYTKSNRGTVVVDKSHLWKGSPFKPLTKGQKFTEEEIILVELHLDIWVAVQNTSTELLIFLEKRKICSLL